MAMDPVQGELFIPSGFHHRIWHYKEKHLNDNYLNTFKTMFYNLMNV